MQNRGLCLGWSRLIEGPGCAVAGGGNAGVGAFEGAVEGDGRCPLFEPCNLHCRRGRGRPFHGFSVSVLGGRGSGGRGWP